VLSGNRWAQTGREWKWHSSMEIKADAKHWHCSDVSSFIPHTAKKNQDLDRAVCDPDCPFPHAKGDSAYAVPNTTTCQDQVSFLTDYNPFSNLSYTRTMHHPLNRN